MASSSRRSTTSCGPSSRRQPMFFVATAPSGDDGHVNLSPKGGRNLFQVTGPLGFAYVDLMGSGIETIAHLRENGRIVVMFCAFDGPPKIVRLHGVGATGAAGRRRVRRSCSRRSTSSDEQRRAVRSVIDVEVTRVADSCGFVVPRMDYVGERDQLYRYADNRLRKEGQDAVRAYVSENNAESIDGLTASTRWSTTPRRSQPAASCSAGERQLRLRGGEASTLGALRGSNAASADVAEPAVAAPIASYRSRSSALAPARRRPSCARRRRRPTARRRGGPARPWTPGRRAASSRRGPSRSTAASGSSRTRRRCWAAGSGRPTRTARSATGSPTGRPDRRRRPPRAPRARARRSACCSARLGGRRGPARVPASACGAGRADARERGLALRRGRRACWPARRGGARPPRRVLAALGLELGEPVGLAVRSRRAPRGRGRRSRRCAPAARLANSTRSIRSAKLSAPITSETMSGSSAL